LAYKARDQFIAKLQAIVQAVANFLPGLVLHGPCNVVFGKMVHDVRNPLITFVLFGTKVNKVYLNLFPTIGCFDRLQWWLMFLK
jgi:hypothetical protein